MVCTTLGSDHQDKRMFQEGVAAVLPGVQKALNVSGPVVVAGDLNVLEPDHDPRYVVFGEWEYDFHGHLLRPDSMMLFVSTSRSGGLFVVWSAFCEDTRNGYRFDHAFVSRAHRAAVVECWYDHSVRTTGLTDHAALSVTLDLAHSVM